MSGVLLTAVPAYADPGDAEAVAAEASLDVTIPPLPPVSADVTIGAVSAGGAPYDAASSTLLDVVIAEITTGVVQSDASSDDTGSRANASVADVEGSLFGLDLISLDAATASVVCAADADATATANVVGLEVLGETATVDVDDPYVGSTLATGAVVGGVDLSAATITVTVEQIEEATASGANAVALVADVSLSGGPLGSSVSLTVVLASASCETPLTAAALDPAVGPTTGGQTVTITGSGFVPGTTVTFDGAPATDIVIDPSGRSLTAVTPAGDLGAATVRVANAGGEVDLAYEYVAPAVASLSPDSGPEYGGTTVTITGDGLEGTTDVTFDGVPATIVSVSPDGTQVVVTSPAGEGTVDVELTFVDGSTLTVDDPFTYVAPAAASLSPDSGPEYGGTTVTITGEGLEGTTDVTFDGVPATVVSVSPDGTQVVVTSPAGEGTVDVELTFVDGSTLTVDDPFTYVAPAAASLSPDSGPEYGGTTVTITGEGLEGTTDVTFDGVPATIVSVSPDGTQVVVTSPAGEGTVDVELTFVDGSTLTVDDPFTYVSPTVSTIDPGAGPVSGGTTVTIGGDGLGGATEVLFDGVPGVIVGTPTDTEIVVTTPPGSAGAVDVTIVLPGDDVVVDDGFQYVPVPVVTGANPGQGPATGGTGVDVTGTGFVPGATTVTICGVTIPAGSVSVNDAGTRLRFTTPACAAGTANIVVTTPGGASAALPFRYVGNGGSLPATGVDPVPGVALGALLLIAGAIATTAAVSRRRL